MSRHIPPSLRKPSVRRSLPRNKTRLSHPALLPWAAVAALASDPLGRGWNLLGSAGDTIDYTWISATTIWYVQIAALVTGLMTVSTMAAARKISPAGQ